jgi:hypothetical protein
MALADHTAAGQAAGYLFQPERALYWLARAPGESTVGVETTDDVVVALRSGGGVQEQTKHGTSNAYVPFQDRGKDLWNTLAIWLRAVRDGEVDLERTEFYLTTNRSLSDCLVKRLGTEPRNISQLVAQLRAAGINPPSTISKVVTEVLAFSDSAIAGLFHRIRVADGSHASSGSALRAQIAAMLHIPVSMPWEALLDQLSGWVHERVKEAWRAQKPAWITKNEFDEQYQRALEIHRQQRVRAKPEHLVPVGAVDFDGVRNSVFVDQLLAVSLVDEDQEINEAQVDFVRCSQERLRLAGEGVLTTDDFKAFDNSLIRRWRQIRRAHCGGDEACHPDCEARDLGYKVLTEVLHHREKLAAIDQEHYITAGSYHRLADDVTIWWNPTYRDGSKGR